jgi:hypothetical protein
METRKPEYGEVAGRKGKRLCHKPKALSPAPCPLPPASSPTSQPLSKHHPSCLEVVFVGKCERVRGGY